MNTICLKLVFWSKVGQAPCRQFISSASLLSCGCLTSQSCYDNRKVEVNLAILGFWDIYGFKPSLTSLTSIEHCGTQKLPDNFSFFF